MALKYGFSLYGVPKSGQTTSYRAGDDGEYEKGYPKSGGRFVDNGDNTITDKATGLMWIKEPEAIGGIWASAGNPVQMVWDDTIDNCNALDYAGHDDWRLPNVKELYSLIDLGRYSPALDPIFSGSIGTDFFSSTTKADATANAHTVVFAFGTIGQKAKTSDAYARPVRLGVPA